MKTKLLLLTAALIAASVPAQAAAKKVQDQHMVCSLSAGTDTDGTGMTLEYVLRKNGPKGSVDFSDKILLSGGTVNITATAPAKGKGSMTFSFRVPDKKGTFDPLDESSQTEKVLLEITREWSQELDSEIHVQASVADNRRIEINCTIRGGKHNGRAAARRPGR